ncbi:MAG: NAD(P)/FAD-dependent oxidoreductase [Rhodococcus fascians]
MSNQFADLRSIVTTADDDELRLALSEANIPTLLLTLTQLTQDRKWLSEPYKPTRTQALNDNDTGGLSVDRQDEIRAAALGVLQDLRNGSRKVPPPPADAEIPELLSISLGETVPAEYGSAMAEEAGFTERPGAEWTAGRPDGADTAHVIIIGAGLSGVAAAINLHRLGIAFTVIEKNDAVGGVWWNNNYPGAGVDTPIHLYSYSFAPSARWSRYYAKQPEILDYIQSVAADNGIDAHVRFRTEVTAATWNDESNRWRVEISNADGTAEQLTATAVISCVGILSRPFVPDLPGLDTFVGPKFHSSRWDHSVDVTGKKVAIIGTGATSMQIVPAIADAAEKTVVFQRSPQWVVPNQNYLRDISSGTSLLMAQMPYYGSFYRLRLIWMFQDKLLATLHKDPEWPHPDRSINSMNEKHRIFFTRHIDSELGDRTDLRPKVVPTYPPYGKRILMDNQWYRTLRRSDVELVDDGVSAVDEHHVVTDDGRRHEVDVLVLATGFRSSELLWPMTIRGRDGVTLREQWGDNDASAYLGVSVPNFPNFFVVAGPNTQLGHGGSAIYVTECAVAYIGQLLVAMIEQGLDSVEVRPEVAADYNERVDAEHEQLIWTHPGTNNWYRNSSGRVVATTPWRGVDYWEMTRTPDLKDYLVTESARADL